MIVQEIRNEEKRVNKTNLQAKDYFDFEKMKKHSPFFLDCEIEDEKEAVVFRYDINRYYSFQELREEDLLIRYAALADIAGLYKLRKEFDFSLDPQNLYYDINAKVRIKERDIKEEDMEYEEDAFVQEYKAVIGAVLQNRYDFEDYMQGGQRLLKKNSFLAQLHDMQTIEEIHTWMHESYYAEKQKREEDYCLVVKQKYRGRFVWGFLMSIAVVVLAVAFSYLYFIKMPYMESVIQAHRDYYEADYIAVIDDLQETDTEKLDMHSKCILATAYVKGENLTAEQKENILSRVTVNGNEKYVCYWIEIGRGNVAEAENIAMQLSDNELLLYAYMKERSQLENDESIDGSEKAKRLEELQRRIDELAENYSE